MSKTILIVDDNSAIRSLLRSLIEQAGFAVCGEAENGRKAIEQALQLKPDLILLDLQMPEMNGAEAASVLKHRLPEVPIILFTLHADDIGDHMRQALHVEEVISKSDGMGTLVESTNRLLRLSHYETASSTGTKSS
jgi:CheY-like chemotaxis protein